MVLSVDDLRDEALVVLSAVQDATGECDDSCYM